LARFFFDVLVYGNLFEIVGFENLTAIEAVHVVDPIPPHQEFRALMLTAWHSKLNYPYSSRRRNLVKPPCGPDSFGESP
jgi:hypothetical protein